MVAPIVEILSAQLRRNFFSTSDKVPLESYEVVNLLIYSISRFIGRLY